jgi:hypothetical protein
MMLFTSSKGCGGCCLLAADAAQAAAKASAKPNHTGGLVPMLTLNLNTHEIT